MLPGKTYAPEDFVRIASRRKWAIILPFVIIALGTVVVAHYLPNRYRSETVILVVPQQVPESYVRSTVTSRIEDRLQSISQQILSRTRLERIIQDFNLYERERQVGHHGRCRREDAHAGYPRRDAQRGCVPHRLHRRQPA